MNRIAFSILMGIVLCGCDGLIVQPSKPDAPVVVADIKAAVSQQAFFTEFAQYIADGNVERTQRVFTLGTEAMQRLHVTPPADWPSGMKKYTDKNLPIDDALRAEIVATLKEWGTAK